MSKLEWIAAEMERVAPAGATMIKQIREMLCPDCKGLGWRPSGVPGLRGVVTCPACGGSGWRNGDDAIEWLRAQLREVRVNAAK